MLHLQRRAGNAATRQALHVGAAGPGRAGLGLTGWRPTGAIALPAQPVGAHAAGSTAAVPAPIPVAQPDLVGQPDLAVQRNADATGAMATAVGTNASPSGPGATTEESTGGGHGGSSLPPALFTPLWMTEPASLTHRQELNPYLTGLFELDSLYYNYATASDKQAGDLDGGIANRGLFFWYLMKQVGVTDKKELLELPYGSLNLSDISVRPFVEMDTIRLELGLNLRGILHNPKIPWVEFQLDTWVIPVHANLGDFFAEEKEADWVDEKGTWHKDGARHLGQVAARAGSRERLLGFLKNSANWDSRIQCWASMHGTTTVPVGPVAVTLGLKGLIGVSLLAHMDRIIARFGPRIAKRLGVDAATANKKVAEVRRQIELGKTIQKARTAYQLTQGASPVLGTMNALIDGWQQDGRNGDATQAAVRAAGRIQHRLDAVTGPLVTALRGPGQPLPLNMDIVYDLRDPFAGPGTRSGQSQYLDLDPEAVGPAAEVTPEETEAVAGVDPAGKTEAVLRQEIRSALKLLYHRQAAERFDELTKDDRGLVEMIGEDWGSRGTFRSQLRDALDVMP